MKVSSHLFGGTRLRPGVGAAESGALIEQCSGARDNAVLKLPIEQYSAGDPSLENDSRISRALHTSLKTIPADIDERRSNDEPRNPQYCATEYYHPEDDTRLSLLERHGDKIAVIMCIRVTVDSQHHNMYFDNNQNTY